MIRLACNLCKKIPIPGCDYSSQSYGAALDIEIADSSDVQTIQSRLQQMYRILEQSIDGQIQDGPPVAGQPPIQSQSVNFLSAPLPPTARIPESSGLPLSLHQEQNSGNGNGTRKATTAQVKAVFAIIKALGIHKDYLNLKVLPSFNVSRPEDLTVAQASEVIKHLKGLNNGTLHDGGRA